MHQAAVGIHTKTKNNNEEPDILNAVHTHRGTEAGNVYRLMK